MNSKVPGFANTFLFERQSNISYGPIGKRTGSWPGHLHQDRSVKWADEQVPLMRSKRDLLSSDEYVDSVLQMLDTMDIEPIYGLLRRKDAQPPNAIFNDELWSRQWYVHDTRTRPGLPKLDLNVLPVWERGITGAGIRVAVLDDGLEHTHEDLRQNYVSAVMV